MNIDQLMHYLSLYGYVILFICLFFGIVGIPAPEESLLFLTGVLISYGKLSMAHSLIFIELGAFIGMIVGYLLGKYLGAPFINRFGKYIGLNAERWAKIENKYNKNAYRTITFGFYLPGMRQISPYFAGITKTPLKPFILFSLIGSIIWTMPFVLLGYFTANTIYINPDYVPYLGIILFILFIVYFIVKKIIGRSKKNKSSNDSDQ